MKNWNNWKITDEQAERIRNDEQDSRDKFYFDNLDRIRAMAYNYAKRNPRCAGYFEDMIQGLYLDLSYFKQENGIPVTDGITLSRFVYSSFRFAPYGGLLYLSGNNPKLLSTVGLKIYAPNMLSLDKPFGIGDNRHQDDDNARTLADTLPAPDTLEKSDYTDDLKTICAAYLSPRDNEYLGLFLDGYSNSEISRKMGYRGDSNNAVYVKEKLRKNYTSILAAMKTLGVDVDYYIGKKPYNPKTGRIYKLTLEQRSRAAERMRRQRAAKKAAKTAIFESTLSKTDNSRSVYPFRLQEANESSTPVK